ncbi:hypothetical protein UPYG_G00131530 [Umbra pygmaea]|uniref:Calpain catalytic domain-containing protein n=1 Tax=Umbra pygmaea TaxID=75934 RepID=A0ABD0WT83_UMBPY
MATMEEQVASQIKREGAKKYLQQDYDKLRQECLARNRLFRDPEFPADINSLGGDEGKYSFIKDIVWKRPTTLCSKPKFIHHGATRTDICQGELGDCWLLAAIASLTLDKDILARVVPSDQSFTKDYVGIFHFQFWQFGEWVDVVIDDRLPTRDGKLLFVHSAEGDEFWSALLEKAYAKLNGCYDALKGGCTIEASEDFTGGIGEVYKLGKDKAPPNLFKIMTKALERGSLMGCSIAVSGSSEEYTSLNLVKGHAYSVTGCEEVHFRGKPVQLVHLRNPWGHKEWTGPWSDSSREWKYVNAEEKLRLDNTAEDGEFWMAYSDFLDQYTNLEICNLTPDTLTTDGVSRWSHYQYKGEWKVGSTAGGCRNNTDTFFTNPQFLLRLENVDDEPLDGEDGCTFLVGLMQKGGRRKHQTGEKLDTIGFSIYKYKGQSKTHLRPEDLVWQKDVNFLRSREVSERFRLPPGKYVIIPSTYKPNKNGEFLLRVFSEKHVKTRMI